MLRLFLNNKEDIHFELNGTERNNNGVFKVKEDTFHSRFRSEKTQRSFIYYEIQESNSENPREDNQKILTKNGVEWLKNGILKGSLQIPKTTSEKAETVNRKLELAKTKPIAKKNKITKNNRDSFGFDSNDFLKASQHTSKSFSSSPYHLKDEISDNKLELSNKINLNSSKSTSPGKTIDSHTNSYSNHISHENNKSQHSNSSQEYLKEDRLPEPRYKKIHKNFENNLHTNYNTNKSTTYPNTDFLLTSDAKHKYTDEDLSQELMHLLAPGPATAESLANTTKCNIDDALKVLPNFGTKFGDRWRLKPKFYKFIKIWDWPRYSNIEREKVISQASKALDTLGVPPNAQERNFLIAPTQKPRNNLNNSASLKENNKSTINYITDTKITNSLINNNNSESENRENVSNEKKTHSLSPSNRFLANVNISDPINTPGELPRTPVSPVPSKNRNLNHKSFNKNSGYSQSLARKIEIINSSVNDSQAGNPIPRKKKGEHAPLQVVLPKQKPTIPGSKPLLFKTQKPTHGRMNSLDLKKSPITLEKVQKVVDPLSSSQSKVNSDHEISSQNSLEFTKPEPETNFIKAENLSTWSTEDVLSRNKRKLSNESVSLPLRKKYQPSNKTDFNTRIESQGILKNTRDTKDIYPINSNKTMVDDGECEDGEIDESLDSFMNIKDTNDISETGDISSLENCLNQDTFANLKDGIDDLAKNQLDDTRENSDNKKNILNISKPNLVIGTSTEPLSSQESPQKSELTDSKNEYKNLKNLKDELEEGEASCDEPEDNYIPENSTASTIKILDSAPDNTDKVYSKYKSPNYRTQRNGSYNVSPSAGYKADNSAESRSWSQTSVEWQNDSGNGSWKNHKAGRSYNRRDSYSTNRSLSSSRNKDSLLNSEKLNSERFLNFQSSSENSTEHSNYIESDTRTKKSYSDSSRNLTDSIIPLKDFISVSLPLNIMSSSFSMNSNNIVVSPEIVRKFTQYSPKKQMEYAKFVYEEYEKLHEKLEGFHKKKAKLLQPILYQWNSALNHFKKEIKDIFEDSSRNKTDTTVSKTSNQENFGKKESSNNKRKISSDRSKASELFSLSKILETEDILVSNDVSLENIDHFVPLKMDLSNNSKYDNLNLYMIRVMEDEYYLCGYEKENTGRDRDTYNRGNYINENKERNVTGQPLVCRKMLNSEHELSVISRDILKIAESYWSLSNKIDMKRYSELCSEINFITKTISS
ncbi:hypothetical protein BB559_001137 [Furculomyces boomerangus]|uniref:Uncharacterized protein n=1 Tax=Furculomyces boomerangus TaxID=61424 RepID=A0A2T9Z2V1_9FUNG|nr:hypothetical protein BB559_001137 [Furculomyces boomerangus]